MELLSVTKPRWANIDHTQVDVDAEFKGLGVVPFTAHPTEGEFGPIIFAAALLGDYGDIAEYVSVEVEPIPDSISRRQFFQQLAVMEIITNAEAVAAMQSGTIPSPLQSIVDDLPTEAEKFASTMLIIGADSFQIAHPLTEVVRLAMEWTEEQRNNFFRAASQL